MKKLPLQTVIHCTSGTPGRAIRYFLRIFLICSLLAGCGAAGKGNDASSAEIPAEQSSVSEAEDIPADNISVESEDAAEPESGAAEEALPEQEDKAGQEPEQGTEPAQEPESEQETESEQVPEQETESGQVPESEQETESEQVPEQETESGQAPERFIENISNNEEGHFSFNPHVFGSRYLEQFGETDRDAFFAYCDALRSGEDSFACPNQEFAGWCSGRLSNFFFPVACEKIETGAWADGRAEILYLIPKEDFLAQEKEFEEAITGILNDSLSDDYSDFEKILALYEYMTTNYTYDYEMYEHSLDWMENQSPYRCLTEGQGICCEIAGLYNYLLLQVGIDSEEMGGTVHYSEDFAEGHSWVFVNLGGKCYHIDPTYGLTDFRPPLCYFMMTDQLREERDMFPIEEFTIAAGGDQSRKLFEYEAVSSDYSELWDGFYIGMDRAAHEILYTEGDEEIKSFSYNE